MIYSKLYTIGEIGGLLHVPYWRVEYICRAKPEIKALGVRVGATTAFDAAAVRKIKQALKQIDSKKSKKAREAMIH